MKLLLDVYHRLLQFALTGLMALMLLPVSLQILSRYTGLVPRYIWTEEVARFCFVWVIMIGSMVAVRGGTHFVVDVLPPAKSPREEATGRLLVHLAMLAFSIVFAWYGAEFALFGAAQTSEVSGLNLLGIYVSFPLAGCTWCLFLLEHLVDDVRNLLAPHAEEETS